MNDKFRMDLDKVLADIEWKNENTERVLKRIKRRRYIPARAAVVLAAAVSVLLALAGIGYAEYYSGIISRLFTSGAIRQEAENLLVSEQITLTKHGVTATVTEYLYDGQTLHIAGEMRNDTDRALLCGMGGQIGGGGQGVFGLSGGKLIMIAPGENANGWLEVSDMGFLQALSMLWKMEIRAVALAPNGEVVPDVNDTEYYSTEKYYGTGLTEIVLEESLSVPIRTGWATALPRTKPEKSRFPMEKYGYTLVVNEANFAAASSRVVFEILPDRLEDIQACGDEGSEGRARLYRNYEILDTNEKRLFEGMTGGSTFGRTTDQRRLRYTFEFMPLATVPEEIVLVPCGDDGAYLMEEKVIIPISAAE